ncbi:hypothetical protein ACOSQ3_026793 [Xanthoceras sorbifolium]
MLAKQGWRLLTSPTSLAAKVLKARYFPSSSFFDSVVGNRPSFIWRSILWGRDSAAIFLLAAWFLWRLRNQTIYGYDNSKGENRSRGRGGRYVNRSDQKIHCQLCAKPGHSALQCYKRFDQQFQGPSN